MELWTELGEVVHRLPESDRVAFLEACLAVARHWLRNYEAWVEAVAVAASPGGPG